MNINYRLKEINRTSGSALIEMSKPWELIGEAIFVLGVEIVEFSDIDIAELAQSIKYAIQSIGAGYNSAMVVIPDCEQAIKFTRIDGNIHLAFTGVGDEKIEEKVTLDQLKKIVSNSVYDLMGQITAFGFDVSQFNIENQFLIE